MLTFVGLCAIEPSALVTSFLVRFQASHRRPFVAKSMKAVANVGDLKLDQFNVDAASKVTTKFGHFVPANHASTKTPVTLMLNPERPLSRKNQNSFSLYPSASFEADDVDEQLVFGDDLGAEGGHDAAESHGELKIIFLCTVE